VKLPEYRPALQKRKGKDQFFNKIIIRKYEVKLADRQGGGDQSPVYIE
jgi:hypothetical protein